MLSYPAAIIDLTIVTCDLSGPLAALSALLNIKLVACRYNQNTGRLTLTCERHADREENRAYIMEQLYALLEEGNRVHPRSEQAQQTVTQ